ncbi:MAG: hypothetical protein K6G73_12890 [Marinilabiliaceae bacterium]|nr:hypothetical protein [Marinilabiliaceae bacterium]
MDWPELIRFTIDALLGGGLLVTLWTLRETKRKAAEEVRQMQTTNAESILRTNEEYIVKPLKREINGLRTTVRNLTKALQRVMDCPHAAGCPVRHEMQQFEDSDPGFAHDIGDANRVRDGT